MRNFNDALIRGIEGKALKKDNLEKHELSAQHRDAIRLEKGPQSVSELYRTTAIGINNYAIINQFDCNLSNLCSIVCALFMHYDCVANNI